ncbi:MAG TPA: YdeI/OmpD-associated family protein [Jiangellales bacterium]|nr:YdeI/OmpD-associated family protein [Jiangellales bacterium]
MQRKTIDDRPRFHPESREQWRAWLADHHDTERGVWLVSWKQATGRPSLPYEAVIEEALCFGWVDSTARTLDDERSMLLMTPRKPTSTWARTNKERVERLLAAGSMQPAGIAAVETAKANGSWTVLDSVEALELPGDLAAALDAEPGARETYEGFSPSNRKMILWWVKSAKRPETRQRRIAETARLAARGIPANQR